MESLPPTAAARSRVPAMIEAGPSGSGDGDSGQSLPVGLYTTLAVLILLATANQWSRAIIFYIVDFSKSASAQPDQFINVALGFDEASYGLIASLAFSALFASTSLLAGAAVDRVDTRALLAGSGVLWGGAMLLQGHAAAFGELLGSRVLLGFSQAFTNPAALCALGRIVPPQNRATVNGAYSSAVYLGGGLAALSVLIDGQIGWRGLSYLAGGVGVFLAVLTYVVLPPLPPAGAETKAVAAAAETELVAAESGGAAAPAAAAAGLGELLSDPLVRALLVASGLRFMGGFTLGVWIVPFYRGAFPGEIGTEFALLKAAVNGVAGSVSAIGGGYLADRWSRTEPRAVVWLPAMGSLLAIPLWVGTLTAPTLTLSLACLFGEYLAAECWFGPVIAALQRAAPPGTQGLTQGSLAALTFLGNLAPLALGAAVAGKWGGTDLPTLLLWSVPLLYAASAAVFVYAGEVEGGCVQLRPLEDGDRE